jgi:hypothetical protein
MVMISNQIRARIDKKAVFIQPFNCTELKYFGRTSSWVEFKAFVKNRSMVFEWYSRIGMIYGISINDKEKGFELGRKADNFFFSLSEASLQNLKEEGVTHLLTRKEFPPKKGTLILQNNTYAVYQL